VTLLGENGGGKTTLLQAISLMLAGPEVAAQLLPRPYGWLMDEEKVGKISCRIHQEKGDSGVYGNNKIRTSFGYSMHVTGDKPVAIRGKKHYQPGFHQSPDKVLSWLRQNAFAEDSKGWFVAGYGAFRRLTRRNQILVPAMQVPSRFSNFSTQFSEDDGLSTLENWLLFVDYQEVKNSSEYSRNLKEISVEAINSLLPTGVRYDQIDSSGRILFDVKGMKVPTYSLSDGYRSILALAGDLVWRMIARDSESTDPLSGSGVVLIDELDIHLHPVWQRQIAGWLQDKFPNIQFIVATHSPIVAAGAGPNALTLRNAKDVGVMTPIESDLFAMSVDDVLKSDAFGLFSTFSPVTQEKLDSYERLVSKGNGRTRAEDTEYKQLKLFVSKYDPFGVGYEKNEIEKRIDDYIKGSVDDKGE